VALGVLLYLTASLVALPTDGTVQAAAFKGGFKLHTVKIVNDCVYTATALALSLAFLGNVSGLGAGTVIAASASADAGVFTRLLKRRCFVYRKLRKQRCPSASEGDKGRLTMPDDRGNILYE
jgi:uncharacterized membrane protein YczE